MSSSVKCLDLGHDALRVIKQCYFSKSCNDLEKELTVGLTSESDDSGYYNIVSNPRFLEGSRSWFGIGCTLAVDVYDDSTPFAIAHNRKESWHGLAQDISKRLESNVEYRMEACLAIAGKEESAQVHAAVKVEKSSGGDDYICLKSVGVTKGKWSILACNLRIRDPVKKAVVVFEGPSEGTAILVRSVIIVPTSTSTLPPSNQMVSRVAHPVTGLVQNPGETSVCTMVKTKLSTAAAPKIQDSQYGVNIVENCNLHNGLSGWFPMGKCTLGMGTGSPMFPGPSTLQSLNDIDGATVPSLSGKYIQIFNRTNIWDGPGQDITQKLQAYKNYQVAVWACTALPGGSGPLAPQKLTVALDVDGLYFDGQGSESMVGENWVEMVGSFRLEREFKKVVVYMQGAAVGVDMKVGGMQIFAIDRMARVPFLQAQADKVRKCDVVVKLLDSNGQVLAPGTQVSIEQRRCSFPIGAAINHQQLTQNEGYKKFVLDNFNWVVFENALKWLITEPNRGQIDYEEADALVKFCNEHQISMRGHCILWEDQDFVQDWVKALEADELKEVVHERFRELLTRFRGQFKHYDVDNEILHGDFYKSRLGAQALASFFKLAREYEPDALLCLNDYHVLEGKDARGTPQKYLELLRFLQAHGAPVGALGVQGHMYVPVGPIIARNLDDIASAGLPIWFTEIDIESKDESIRADDLEVLFREAFAHPSVEGCLFWGFMEGAMYRPNSALLNADATPTEAGKRLLALQKEWTTSHRGVVADNGVVTFRGYVGDYTLTANTDGMVLVKTFRVTKGDGPSHISI